MAAAGDADVLLLGLRQGEGPGDVVEALGLLDGEDALRAELAVDVVDEDARRRLVLLRRLRKRNGWRGGGESRRLEKRASFQGFLLGWVKLTCRYARRRDPVHS
jgi:hypothetical protein